MKFSFDLSTNARSDASLAASILTYLKSKAKNNKIHITKRSVYFDKNHVTVKMNLGNEEVEGSGCAKSKNEAALKAVMELFERFIFLTQKIDVYRKVKGDDALKSLENIFSENPGRIPAIVASTTNGMAAHSNHFCSLDAAINEAIERHVLLKAMALNIKPKLISDESISPLLTELISIKTYLWKGPLNKYIISIKASFGDANCYGFGCSDSLKNAIEKAECEIAPRIEILGKSKTYAHLKLRDNEHFDYHLLRLSPWAHDFFDKGLAVDVPEIDMDLKHDDFWFGDYRMPEDCKIEGLSVLKVVSPKLQPLFNGKWDVQKMNVSAFEQKAPLNLPKELHVVG